MIIGITVDLANDEPVTINARIDAVQRFEQLGFDVAVLTDAFGASSLASRYDAELVAATLASVTNSITLIPATDTSHTEPFHLAKNLATLDIVSDGRAGWWPRVSLSSEVAALFGRRPAPNLDEAWAEACDAIEVVRRLWDSWEDGAVIREVATGRYVDVDKLHYVDFVGTRFSVRGPSITPRSPQGQLPIWVDATEPGAAVLIDQADLVVVTSESDESYEAQRREIRASLVRAGRDANEVRVIAALGVELVESASAREGHHGLASAFSGAPQQLTTWLRALEVTANIDGVVLRPTTDAVTAELMGTVDVTGRLSSRGTGDAPLTLRERLGLGRLDSRYATVQP